MTTRTHPPQLGHQQPHQSWLRAAVVAVRAPAAGLMAWRGVRRMVCVGVSVGDTVCAVLLLRCLHAAFYAVVGSENPPSRPMHTLLSCFSRARVIDQVIDRSMAAVLMMDQAPGALVTTSECPRPHNNLND
jgi:hypothetical protein